MLQLWSEGPLFEILPKTSKKLVLVLDIPVTDNSSEEFLLKKVPYIHNLVWFQEN